MSHKSDDGFSSFLGGVFLGAMAGFMAGILSANKPGRELRRELEANSEDLFITLKDKLEVLKDRASVHLEDFRGFTDEKFKKSALNIQDKVTELGKQLDELIENEHENNGSSIEEVRK